MFASLFNASQDFIAESFNVLAEVLHFSGGFIDGAGDFISSHAFRFKFFG